MISENLLGDLDARIREVEISKALIQRDIEERDKLTQDIEEIDSINRFMLDELEALRMLDKMLKKYQKDKREYSRSYLSELMKIWMLEIFPQEGYEFKIDTYTRGKHTYSKLLNTTYYSGGRSRIPKLSSGFGARQSMSFFACVIIAMLAEITPMFMLDEMFSLLSPDKKRIMSSILGVLEEMGFQLIMIEQEPHVFDRVEYREITLSKTKGVTSVVSTIDINKEIEDIDSEYELEGGF